MASGVAMWNANVQDVEFYTVAKEPIYMAEQVRLQQLREFSKEGVLDAHKELYLYAKHHNDKSADTGLFRSCLPVWKDEMAKPLSSSSKSLKNVGLTDLELGKCHQGCSLHGFLLPDAFRISNVAVTALEDDSGKVARLMAANALSWDAGREEVAQIYPKGAEVILKEPCLVEARFCTGVTLWVPNPKSLEIISRFPGIEDDLERLLKLAGREMKFRNYFGSLELLNRAIRLLEEHSDELEAKNKLVSALATRSEVWMGLSYFEKALADATRALLLDPGDNKSLFAKAMAYFGLKQYELFRCCIDQLADEAAPEKREELQNTRAAAVMLEEQSKQGIYELSPFYENECKEEEAPDLAEFVGPLEVGRTPDGLDRGLFLTRDVKAGDILIVSNAAAIVFPNKNSAIMQMDRYGNLLTELLKTCIASPRTLAQVYSLPQMGEVMSEEDPLPDMNLFRPNCTSFRERDLELDVARVAKVVQYATVHGRASDSLESRHYEALWTLPGFLRHSCLPNVGVHRVGKSLIAVAAKDLEAGSELLRAYCGAFTPLGLRKLSLRQPNCGCQRCVLEQRLNEELKDFTERYDSILAADTIEEHEFHKILAEIAVDLEGKLGLLDLSKEETQWLRASYNVAYLAYYTLFKKKKKKNKESKQQEVQEEVQEEDENVDVPPSGDFPPAEVLAEALHATAPGYSLTLMTMCLFTQYVTGRRQRGFARELLEKECAALCGRQRPHVSTAILKMAAKKGKKALW